MICSTCMSRTWNRTQVSLVVVVEKVLYTENHKKHQNQANLIIQEVKNVFDRAKDTLYLGFVGAKTAKRLKVSKASLFEISIVRTGISRVTAPGARLDEKTPSMHNALVNNSHWRGEYDWGESESQLTTNPSIIWVVRASIFLVAFIDFFERPVWTDKYLNDFRVGIPNHCCR